MPPRLPSVDEAAPIAMGVRVRGDAAVQGRVVHDDATIPDGTPVPWSTAGRTGPLVGTVGDTPCFSRRTNRAVPQFRSLKWATQPAGSGTLGDAPVEGTRIEEPPGRPVPWFDVGNILSGRPPGRGNRRDRGPLPRAQEGRELGFGSSRVRQSPARFNVGIFAITFLALGRE